MIIIVTIEKGHRFKQTLKPTRYLKKNLLKPVPILTILSKHFIVSARNCLASTMLKKKKIEKKVIDIHYL